MFEFAAPFGSVGEIAIVRKRELALVAIDEDWLRVGESCVAGSGIARVADGGIAGERREPLIGKNIGNESHTFYDAEFCAIGSAHSGSFLAAMLQGVEAEVGGFRGVGLAENAEDAAMIVEMIVDEMPANRSAGSGAF